MMSFGAPPQASEGFQSSPNADTSPRPQALNRPPMGTQNIKRRSAGSGPGRPMMHNRPMGQFGPGGGDMPMRSMRPPMAAPPMRPAQPPSPQGPIGQADMPMGMRPSPMFPQPSPGLMMPNEMQPRMAPGFEDAPVAAEGFQSLRPPMMY